MSACAGGHGDRAAGDGDAAAGGGRIPGAVGCGPRKGARKGIHVVVRATKNFINFLYTASLLSRTPAVEFKTGFQQTETKLHS